MGKPDLGRLIAQTMAPPTEGRTIEVITGDILEAQRKGGEAVLTIGKCLIEAKDMLSHGEWLPWLAEKVGYSEKTAQNFMRLAREFSNPQAIADLGATKALKLLALPPDEREKFVADHNVIDMTTRQLEQAIKERDEAKAAAEQAAADQRTAERARDKMAEDMRLLNASLASAQDARERAERDAARLEQDLAELKARPVEVAVEPVVDQAAIDKARADAIAEMQEKLDKAKEAAAKAKDKQKQAEASVEILKRSLEERDKSEKKAASLPRTMLLSAEKGVERLTTMDFLTTLRAVKRMKVETGSMVCLGCRFEHNCSVHGCAILCNAAEHMEAALANIDHLNALLDQRDTQEGEGK